MKRNEKYRKRETREKNNDASVVQKQYGMQKTEKLVVLNM